MRIVMVFFLVLSFFCPLGFAEISPQPAQEQITQPRQDILFQLRKPQPINKPVAEITEVKPVISSKEESVYISRAISLVIAKAKTFQRASGAETREPSVSSGTRG